MLRAKEDEIRLPQHAKSQENLISSSLAGKFKLSKNVAIHYFSSDFYSSYFLIDQNCVFTSLFRNRDSKIGKPMDCSIIIQLTSALSYF